MIGQTLNNRYTVTSRIGSGAMGTVYRATDSQTTQDVAIKVISRDFALNVEMMERFRREGEALQQLRHPNIVSFVDAFQHDEQYVIVMEYVSGGSLRDLIKQGNLPIDRVRQIALDLCDALTRAHRLNIIHCDIKPENVLLADDGTPKLTDFGVAKLMSQATRLTGTSTQVGAPYYMCPEAWEGRPLDAQADIWSLGIVIYEMLAGEVPFGGETLMAVMNKVLNSPPPDLKTKRADVPTGLTQVVKRMLTRDKAKRYPTIRQVAADLELASGAAADKGGEEVTYDAREEEVKKKESTEQRKRTAQWMRVGAAGVVVMGLIGAAVFLNNQITSIRSLQFPAAVIPQTSTPRPTATLDINAAATLIALSATPTPTLSIGAAQVSSIDNMTLLYVPEGKFKMGSETGDPDETPVHDVELDAFWIDKTEVTNAMYALCITTDVCKPTHTNVAFPNYQDAQYVDHPVDWTTWDDANTYCNWAKRRLPTEAEWEKAARGTDGRIYPWGNNFPDSTLLNFNQPVENMSISYIQVGKFPKGASPYGALDLAGSLWEWVSDVYDDKYYGRSPVRNPYFEGANDNTRRRVRRGGGRFDGAFSVRTTERNSWSQDSRAIYNGFRCALSASR